MNQIYAMPQDELRGEIYQRIRLLMGKNRGTWAAVGAVAGLGGGMLSLVLGLLVWVVVGLVGPARALGPTLDVVGTVLLILPLPLLALGAHCLDLLEEKAPALPLPGAPRVARRPARYGRRAGARSRRREARCST